MASPKDLIDAAVNYYDGVDPDDLDNVPRRQQLASFLQHIYEYIRNYRPWQWTYTSVDFAVPAGQNFLALATAMPGYMAFGEDGHLFDPARRIRMRELTLHDFARLKEELVSSLDWYFAIYDEKVQLPVAPAANRTLRAYYRTVAETIVHDSTTPLTMPDRYCRTVLLPGLIFRTQEIKSDARDTWQGQFRDGLSQMCEEENPVKTGFRRLPNAVRGGW